MKLRFYKRCCNIIKELWFLICFFSFLPVYDNDEKIKMNYITVKENAFLFYAEIIENSWYFNVEKDKIFRADLFFRCSDAKNLPPLTRYFNR